MLHANPRRLGGGRHQVVHQRGRQRLAVLVVRRLLVQRGADALHDAADGLALDDHRVDHGAAILGHDVVEHLDRTELRIDRDGHRVRGIAEHAGIDLGSVRHAGLEAAAVDVARKPLGTYVPGVRDLGHRDRSLGTDDPATLVAHLLLAAAEQRRADAHHARDERVAGAGHRAARHHHAARRIGAG